MAIPKLTSCTTHYDQILSNQMNCNEHQMKVVSVASKGMWSHMKAQVGHDVIVSVPSSIQFCW
eukprot:scaffold105452_cov17-Prasinocladus_malaysianus.AAC.1